MLAVQRERRGWPAVGELEQPFFEFAAQNGLDALRAENGFVQGCVEAIGAEARYGIERTEFGNNFQRQTGCRVHRKI